MKQRTIKKVQEIKGWYLIRFPLKLFSACQVNPRRNIKVMTKPMVMPKITIHRTTLPHYFLM